MTDIMTPRERWKHMGKLWSCPNPEHKFTMGRVIGSWQWAKEAWCFLQDSGDLKTIYVGFTKTDNLKGYTVYNLILWKFSIIFGVLS